MERTLDFRVLINLCDYKFGTCDDCGKYVGPDHIHMGHTVDAFVGHEDSALCDDCFRYYDRRCAD